MNPGAPPMPAPAASVKEKTPAAPPGARLFQQACQILNDFWAGDVVAVANDADLHGARGIADEPGEERVAAAADERRRKREEGVARPDGIDDLAREDRDTFDVAALSGDNGAKPAVGDDEVRAVHALAQLLDHRVDRRIAVGYRKPRFRLPGWHNKFDARALKADLSRIVGDRTLDTPDLQTGLAVVLKRIDAGGAWILSNNPHGKFWETPAL